MTDRYGRAHGVIALPPTPNFKRAAVLVSLPELTPGCASVRACRWPTIHRGAPTGVDTRLRNADADAGISIVPHLTGLTATFTIWPSDKLEPDFRAKGALRYVGERYLQFDDGDFFLKVGADSPENLLGYFEFDGTRDGGGFRDLQPDTEDHLHHFATHRADWRAGDPVRTSSAAQPKRVP